MKSALKELKRHLIQSIEACFEELLHKENRCLECGDEAKHRHHVIPNTLDGKATVPLCEKHHGLIHTLDLTDHGVLTKLGMEKARARGAKIGAPRRCDHQMVVKLRSSMRTQEIAKVMGISRQAVCKILRKAGKEK